MKMIKVYNHEGNPVSEHALSEHVFGVRVKSDVVHTVATILAGNRRQASAHTKTRGEVRGGGKKPWKQKGTGRARHGSIRSPIWRGGGVVFGPRKTDSYARRLPAKMNQLATRMVLTDKVTSGRLIVVEHLNFSEAKTKAMADLRKRLPGAGRSTLVVTPAVNKEVVRLARNIPRVDIDYANRVSMLDLLNHEYVIATPETLAALTKRLEK